MTNSIAKTQCARDCMRERADYKKAADPTPQQLGDGRVGRGRQLPSLRAYPDAYSKVKKANLRRKCHNNYQFNNGVLYYRRAINRNKRRTGEYAYARMKKSGGFWSLVMLELKVNSCSIHANYLWLMRRDKQIMSRF